MLLLLLLLLLFTMVVMVVVMVAYMGQGLEWVRWRLCDWRRLIRLSLQYHH